MSTDRTPMPTATWFKSSYSSGNTDEQCIETAGLGTSVGIRDSKDLAQGHLTVPKSAWASLIDTITS
ncbi:DUF397 domain-containing protein [Yinghuangia soli]|uniref:DUF397 domain-containing protein n=1 Tax=Yinghuangia soli TaxID=2908204 RepID=A0AA41QAP6_9ACTN|nr:DUF397 domain-containing protein [Yinghuangia soli]MCF2533990.1 DUF397 domain-containing protein [Yinghuangia soli]